VRRIDLPERNVMAPKPCKPACFWAFLAWSWAEGTTKGRHLYSDIRHRGFIWPASSLRSAPFWDGVKRLSSDQEAAVPPRVRTLDPMTGRQISPMTAAVLCVKPRGQMTARQSANADALASASAEFTTMRHLVMRFRGLLRGGTTEKRMSG
jgi:hypothetical protein